MQHAAPKCKDILLYNHDIFTHKEINVISIILIIYMLHIQILLIIPQM